MKNQRPKKNRSIKLGAILTISWTVILIWLNTAQAQSPMTNSAFDTVVALKPSNLDILADWHRRRIQIRDPIGWFQYRRRFWA